MPENRRRIAGRHYLQVPGPTRIPERILRSMDAAVLDHRGADISEARARTY